MERKKAQTEFNNLFKDIPQIHNNRPIFDDDVLSIKKELENCKNVYKYDVTTNIGFYNAGGS